MLSNMTILHGIGVSLLGPMTTSMNVLFATNTKGAKQHDAEQEQYEGLLVILYKLVDTSCLKRTISDDMESFASTLGVVPMTTCFCYVSFENGWRGCERELVSSTAAETTDFHGLCLRRFEGVTNCGLAAS